MIEQYFSFDTEINDQGGVQSESKTAFHLIPAITLFKVAEIMHVGTTKYGEDNWRKIPIRVHLGRAIQHIYAYLLNDRTEDHLSHALCRLFFAAELHYGSKPD
jgi:hypothetical protein